MRLRGRFTLTLALAALVPISVAAVVSRQVIASTYRKDYEDTRSVTKSTLDRELHRMLDGVQAVTESFANEDYNKQQPLIGAFLNEAGKGTLESTSNGSPPIASLRSQASALMRALSLSTLTIAGIGGKDEDKVWIAPHLPDLEGDYFAHDKGALPLRDYADRTKGAPYFAFEVIRTKNGLTPTAKDAKLVAKSTKVATRYRTSATVSTGRRVTEELLDIVRHDVVDARIVDTAGEVLVPQRVKDWEQFSSDKPDEIELKGFDDKPVARVEIVVSDEKLDYVLHRLTYVLAGLALGALGVVVVIGLLVAKRTARDLDALVVGSLAASRGELEYRVPVRSDDEIGAVASAFNFMMEDLRTSKERLVIAERIAAWQEIARRLAHEIKNPLTPIQMAMDTLRKTWKKQHPSFDEILEESTTTVLQEADRLKHLVAEFSDFARMPKPEFQRIDLNESIRSAVSLYQGAISIETKLLPGLPHLDADKGQVNQVLINLVENARDAIGKRADGKITVSTRMGEAGDRAILVVDDNGPGIPAELKEKVFAPYFTTKHAKGGTGLGLAIVHRIVSDHGGRIAVSDAPGGGARFSIELPLRNGTALLASRI